MMRLVLFFIAQLKKPIAKVTILDLIKTYLPINGLKEDSFARFTLQYRLPAIIDGILKDNKYESKIEADLKGLKDKVIHGKIDDSIASGPDLAQWNIWIDSFRTMSWFEVPFYFAEAYFYRLVIDIIGFFDRREDPFALQKDRDIQENIDHFILMLSEVDKMERMNFESGTLMKSLLIQSLWGNKSDLSQLAKSKKGSDDFLIIDDTESISIYLTTGVHRVDIILDNSGVELFSDLMLAYHLVQSQKADQVVLHTKAFPTFVSDATSKDIEMLLKTLKNHGDKLLFEFSSRVGDLLSKGKIDQNADLFWNSPLHFFEMTESLRNELNKSDLIIFKGDANYRRIFGDRKIPNDLKFSSITDYLPAKSMVIRVLKSEIFLGMKSEENLRLSEMDDDWMINGKYGIIQMLN